MPSAVENIFQNFMADPNFELGKPENERREIAWRLAWDRYHQTERNNVALAMAKESIGTVGPDAGTSKYPAKIGGPTTIENTKKFGQERINLHKDPNRTWRTRPETASEVTSDKELEKISPMAAAKKFFGKPPKTLEELEIERMRRDFGYTEKGEMPLNKQEQFKTYLKKHLTDTLEEEPCELGRQDSSETVDSEMMSETAITIDTIIDALTELRDNISQHELDEMTGQNGESSSPENGLEVFEFIRNHYTGPGGKHEHLESGQWVRPGMKTVPGKTWGGKVLAKEGLLNGTNEMLKEKSDYSKLDFKDQSAVAQETKLFAQGKLKKPVAKQIESRGKSGTFNIQGAVADKPILAPKPTRAPKLSSMTDAEKTEYFKPIPAETVKKHEDYSMHGHTDLSPKEKTYPFLSHLIPPIKTKPVGKSAVSRPEPLIRNSEGVYVRKPSPNRIWLPPVKKDTSSISEITEVQKKVASNKPISKPKYTSEGIHLNPYDTAPYTVAPNYAGKIKNKPLNKVSKSKSIKNVFAIATEAAKRAGFSDFSEGSPGKEKRGEIAEALKRKEGIKKEAQKTLYNVLSNRKYSAPDTLSSAPMTTGVTHPQLRVE